MTDQQSPVKHVPVRVYIPEEKHRKLKAKLALDGISLSEWFRNKADEELNK